MDALNSYSGLVAMISFLGTAVLIPLVKFSLGRMIKSLEETSKLNTIKQMELDAKFAVLDKEIVRVQEQLKEVPECRQKISALENIRVEMLEKLEKYLPRGDFIREIQIVSNQIEANYKKTDTLANAVDKLREGHR